MYSSLFRKKLIFALIIIMLLFTALFSANTIRNSFAEQQSAEWDNYDVITDAQGQFVGINIKNSPRGTLSIAVPAGSETALGLGLVTFELGQINSSETTGLLLQIDRRHATADQGPRIYLEDKNGVLYRLSNATARNDVFITEDGTVTSMQSTNQHRYTLTSGVCGTLYVPWTVLTATGTKTPDGTGTPPSVGSALVAGTVFTRLHFGLEMRNTGWHGLNRATAFGTIGTVTVNGTNVTAKEILNVATLNYSINENDTKADINLADITKGTKVYARHSISGSFVFDESPETVAATINIHSWSRTSAELTVRYVNTENEEIHQKLTQTIPYDSLQGNFPYEISAPNIPGYGYIEQSAELFGSLESNGNLTLIYEEVIMPLLTINYIDDEGNSIKESEVVYTDFDKQTGISSYNIEPTNVFSYEFVSSDKPLQGTFAEDIEITLTYKKVVFQNYDVITDVENNFIGINIKNSMTGSLVADVTTFDDSTGYGIITFELGRFNPFDSTGFLLQFARLNANMAQVRMYIEAEDGTMYRFFSGGDVPSRDDVLIKPDGSISAVSSENTFHRHIFGANQEGTLYIPWDNVYKIGSDSPIEQGTVFTRFHFGREMRYQSSVNRPIAIGTIAAVKVDGDSVVVNELLNLTKLSFTADGESTAANVNLSNYENGSKVYVRHWASGSHVFDADSDGSIYERTLEIWNLTRMPPQITLIYIDENNNTIRANSIAQGVYAPTGSTYNITPPSIVGFNFQTSDKPLEGVSEENFEIILTYESVDYIITLEFKDENGKVIKESRTIAGKFGSYHEIEADVIQGYTFKEATNSLKFTITNNRTIVLYYTKNTSGTSCFGAYSPASTIIVLATLILFFATINITKKKS